MNQRELELCIAFEQEKVIFFFEINTPFSAFVSTLANHFNISEQQIKLIEEERNAEVVSTRSLDSNKHYKIVLKQLESNEPSLQIFSISQPFPLHQNQVPNNEKGKISLNYFKGKKIASKHLLNEINEWAGTFKFKLALSEGKKKQKQGYKRTFACSNAKCNFKLVFLSDLEEKDYSLNFEGSIKYDTHSKLFFIFVDN